MTERDWLSVEDAIIYHKASIEKTGGSEGIRDRQLLESALAKPRNLAAYETPSVHDLAASYAEGIARNHPFVDGNKRTALAAALAFLDKNGVELAVERNNELTEMVEGLAQGIVSREAFAKHLRANSHKLQNVEQPSPEIAQAQDSAPTLSPDHERQARIDARRATREARKEAEREQPGVERER